MVKNSKIQARILERKLREKEEMKAKIVRAAREMFLKDGYEKVSMRRIAEKIAYSPATIYLHFENKDEIFHAVHEEGFQLLFSRLEPLMEIENPLERLMAMGREYWTFAAQHPEDYDLMFILRAPMNSSKEDKDWRCGEHAFGLLYQTVSDCVEKGLLKTMKPDAMAFMIWSTMHGMVSLKIRDRLRMYENETIDKMAQAAIYQLAMMFKA